jgi:LAGLIDADG DNA endonuclease family protein
MVVGMNLLLNSKVDGRKTRSAESLQKQGETRRKLFAEGKLKTTKGRVTRKNLEWSEESKRKISETRKKLYSERKLKGNRKIREIPTPDISDEFGNWFAGFTDGEGCFYISKFSGYGGLIQAGFKISVRKDDEEIVREIHRLLGFGTVGYSQTRTTAAVGFRVAASAHCMALVNLFTRYPLRAKKRRDFEIWRKLVQICYDETKPTYVEHKDLIDALSAVKKFKVETA